MPSRLQKLASHALSGLSKYTCYATCHDTKKHQTLFELGSQCVVSISTHSRTEGGVTQLLPPVCFSIKASKAFPYSAATRHKTVSQQHL